MKYYVTADIHGYFSEFKTALSEKGFFDDDEPHRLIVCGDLFDRGGEALELQSFILDLMSECKVILIRGNHEDLTVDLLNNWGNKSYLKRHHYTNGTVDTLCQLSGLHMPDIISEPEKFKKSFVHIPYVKKIIPSAVNYFETKNYIFTHGWIPCTVINPNPRMKKYVPQTDWRNASQDEWDKARWTNGMEAAHCGVTEKGKTIVCGHWHCSFGHSRYEGDGDEFDNPNFSPYYGNGIIALDACTAMSGKVNCIVIDD